MLPGVLVARAARRASAAAPASPAWRWHGRSPQRRQPRRMHGARMAGTAEMAGTDEASARPSPDARRGAAAESAMHRALPPVRHAAPEVVCERPGIRHALQRASGRAQAVRRPAHLALTGVDRAAHRRGRAGAPHRWLRETPGDAPGASAAAVRRRAADRPRPAAPLVQIQHCSSVPSALRQDPPAGMQRRRPPAEWAPQERERAWCWSNHRARPILPVLQPGWQQGDEHPLRRGADRLSSEGAVASGGRPADA